MPELNEQFERIMSGLKNLETRINYRGGVARQDRMTADKLRTLKIAMNRAYQGATAILADGREFRCLINPDKLKNSADDKIISIPFEDVCLNKPRKGTTTQGIEPIGMKPGDVFEWKNTGTYWLVYLQRLEELAYFRAEIRRCQDEVEVDEDHKYKIAIIGPTNQDIDWNIKNGIMWNDLNYHLAFYITKDEITQDFFHRFTKLKIRGKTWEVQTVNNFLEGIIEVYCKEYYSEDMKDRIEEEIIDSPEEESPIVNLAIEGPDSVKPYDVAKFEIKNYSDGVWSVSNTKAIISAQNSSHMELKITTGRSGKFIIYYKVNGEIVAEKEISILSL